LATITYAHHALIQGNRNGAILGTFLTLVLAITFTGLQGLEYMQASFSMSDSVFGTVFFASTGLHGLTYMAPVKISMRRNFSKIDFITVLQLVLIVILLHLLDQISSMATALPIGSELAIFIETFNPQGAWGLVVSDSLSPLLVQILFSAVPPIKPVEDEPVDVKSSRLTKLEQSQFALTEDLQAILEGLSLGDLFINKQNVNARLEFKQGLIHVDYLMEVYEQFKKFSSL
jgi:hypothetical protein